MASGNIVKLNIGGVTFQTTRSTLTKYDCMIRAMLESGVPVELDPSGCIFIDRDPTHFRLILNFMRDDDVELPKDQKEVKEILREAEYYLLEGLVQLCQNQTGYRVLKDQSELIDLLMKTKKDVLVLEYPFLFYFTFEQENLKKLISKYENRVDIVFLKTGKKNEQHWHFKHYRHLHPKRDQYDSDRLLHQIDYRSEIDKIVDDVERYLR